MPPGQGAPHWQEHVWFPTSPLRALKASLPSTAITFDAGKDLDSAAAAAKKADVAIVFAYQWESEGMDLPSLTLPDDQDRLIERVAAANPHTLVVLESGTAVTMPWASKVQGIVEAWYAGSAGEAAVANVLTGKVNPTAKLAMTFPLSENDLPQPHIAKLSPADEGQGTGAVNGPTHVASTYSVDYTEGARVGYKWYEAEHKPVLFPFGFGMSYTAYEYADMTVSPSGHTATVHFTVRYTGTVAGTEIAQVYVRLPQSAGENFQRLAAWKRVELAPGETQAVTLTLDPRVLAIFDERANAWQQVPGTYLVTAGRSSEDAALKGSVELP